jgi:hypothetical protein
LTTATTTTAYFMVSYENPVRTSQETHHVTTTKTSRLSENDTERINALCEAKVEISNVKACGTMLYKILVKHFRFGELAHAVRHIETVGSKSTFRGVLGINED